MTTSSGISRPPEPIKISGLKPKYDVNLNNLLSPADADGNGYINNGIEATKAIQLMNQANVASDFPQTMKLLANMQSYYTNNPVIDHSKKNQKIVNDLEEYFVKSNFRVVFNTDKNSNKAKMYYVNPSGTVKGLSDIARNHLVNFLVLKGFDREELKDPEKLHSAFAAYKKSVNVNTNYSIIDRLTFDAIVRDIRNMNVPLPK